MVPPTLSKPSLELLKLECCLPFHSPSLICVLYAMQYKAPFALLFTQLRFFSAYVHNLVMRAAQIFRFQRYQAKKRQAVRETVFRTNLHTCTYMCFQDVIHDCLCRSDRLKQAVASTCKTFSEAHKNSYGRWVLLFGSSGFSHVQYHLSLLHVAF